MDRKCLTLIKNANNSRIAKQPVEKTRFVTRLRRTSSTPDLCKLARSNIFSSGKLLHTIQMSNLYKDSKTFVDMATRFDANEVLSNFEKLGDSPSTDDLQKFVSENFHESGFDLIKAEPKDWHENAPFLFKLSNEKLINFGKFLNCKWKLLLRSFDRSKINKNSATTALCTKNSFIVPGGRFIEYYYWDTFWIVEGLLSSGMHHTARGIIENFLEIVKQCGFVPNGSRIYYLNRSQPPLLTQMVNAYYKATNDKKFLEEAVVHLDTEYNFWMKKKALKIAHDGQNYKLNWYKVKSNNPRPESYREDYDNAQVSGNAEFYFSNIMSATESGWDFSSRWFNDPMDIKSIQIVNMVPVDLNSIMFQNEKILKEIHETLGHEKMTKFYETAAQKREKAINAVLWDKDLLTWGDYNIKTKKLNSNFLYITDLSPLWSGIQPQVDENIILNRYKSILFDHPSGIPASNIQTGQQWDFPNVWAPYHYYVVDYFRQKNRMVEAKDIAERLVNTVYIGWLKTNYIFEKYHADKLGEYGGGGEYVVQEGFGWTNGTVIKFIDWFGDDIKLTDETESVMQSISELESDLEKTVHIEEIRKEQEQIEVVEMMENSSLNAQSDQNMTI